MTILTILAVFYIAVLLVKHYSTPKKAILEVVVNVLVIAGFVIAILACFGTEFTVLSR